MAAADLCSCTLCRLGPIKGIGEWPGGGDVNLAAKGLSGDGLRAIVGIAGEGDRRATQAKGNLAQRRSQLTKVGQGIVGLGKGIVEIRETFRPGDIDNATFDTDITHADDKDMRPLRFDRVGGKDCFLDCAPIIAADHRTELIRVDIGSAVREEDDQWCDALALVDLCDFAKGCIPVGIAIWDIVVVKIDAQLPGGAQRPIRFIGQFAIGRAKGRAGVQIKLDQGQPRAGAAERIQKVAHAVAYGLLLTQQ